ncbi:MAG: rod shape-determining protein RodA [Candidatus Omnitrophica bacterium]|nr:rod shape-determining protein RodA [Candidatus Omnitrophota bacterium]
MYRNFDRVLLVVALVIFVIGISSIYSATYTEGSSALRGLVLKQCIWMAVALVILFIVISIDYQRFVDFAYILFGLNVILLIIVLIFGRTRFGAQRWFSIGVFGFQPSEFLKITFILALSSYLGSKAKFTYQPSDLVVPFIIMLLPLTLIYMQPDLGTALMLIPILFSMLIVRGVRIRHLLTIVILGLSALPFMWFMLKDYQRQRLSVFIDPNADPLGAGYTMIQSRIAIGSGFVFGKGWLSGTQNQLNFLPERHTDFIFSVIGEEGGFIGCIILLALYCILIYRGLKIAQTTGDTYGRLMATGIVSMIACQVIVNTGMASGFMPVVGLPLPLMSYGGSSLLTTMISIALLLSIGMRKPRF